METDVFQYYVCVVPVCLRNNTCSGTLTHIFYLRSLKERFSTESFDTEKKLSYKKAFKCI